MKRFLAALTAAFALSVASADHASATPAKNDSLLGTDVELPQIRAIRRAAALDNGILIAQTEGDDAYDPFADYSEFEESMEEEEDINFFRNGRLFTMGFIAGYRGWTGTLKEIYSGDPIFGLYLSYFFDLRFALQFGFVTGSHGLAASGPSEELVGNVSAADISFNLKYYFNTQNVTRGLADLNPYLIGGFSQVLRTVSIDLAADEVAKDTAFGFNIGAGIEVPMMRNKMYFGLQGAFQYINFPDENKYLVQSDGQTRVVKPKGDSFTAVGILGTNF